MNEANSKILYNKYRPQKLHDVVGQENVVKILKSIIKGLNKSKKSELTTQAFMFSGARGTGKTSSARIFAKAINCQNSQDGDACNYCPNCQKFSNATDIIEIDAASNSGVDNIRNIISSSTFLPTEFRYRVFIIDEIHMLSNNASSALLKTLEEPNNFAIFILLTTEPHNVLSTVISRCIHLHFHKLSINSLKKYVLSVINKEQYKIDDKALTLIVQESQGSARDALVFLQKITLFISGKNNCISEEIVKKFQENLSSKLIIDFTLSVLKNNIKLFNYLISTLFQFEYNIRNFVLRQLKILMAIKVITFFNQGKEIVLTIKNAKVLSEDEQSLILKMHQQEQFLNISNDRIDKLIKILNDFLFTRQASDNNDVYYQSILISFLSPLKDTLISEIKKDKVKSQVDIKSSPKVIQTTQNIEKPDNTPNQESETNNNNSFDLSSLFTTKQQEDASKINIVSSSVNHQASFKKSDNNTIEDLEQLIEKLDNFSPKSEIEYALKDAKFINLKNLTLTIKFAYGINPDIVAKIKINEKQLSKTIFGMELIFKIIHRDNEYPNPRNFFK